MFDYEGDSLKISMAIDIANELIENEEFLTEIYESNFDMATCDGSVVVRDIKNFKEAATRLEMWRILGSSSYSRPVEVKLYKSFWRWSKAVAMFKPSEPRTIYLNSRKLHRTKEQIVGTLFHEFVHIIDHLNKQHSYGHGDNSSIGKENTAPYWIGNLAVNYAGGLEDFNNTENKNIKTAKPWYYYLNPLNWF